MRARARVDFAAARRRWPSSAVEQLTALQGILSTAALTPDEVLAAFTGARREIVQRHLDTLTLMWELRLLPSGRYESPADLAAT
jgi:hypothetical protein